MSADIKLTRIDIRVTPFPENKTRPIFLKVFSTMPEAHITDESSPIDEFFDAPEDLPLHNQDDVTLRKSSEASTGDYGNTNGRGRNVNSENTRQFSNYGHKIQIFSENSQVDEEFDVFQDAVDSEVKLALTNSSGIDLNTNNIILETHKQILTSPFTESLENDSSKTLRENGIISSGKPPSGLSQSRGSRFPKDFIPLNKRNESVINEDTRKIIMMLENDKACKVPRPNLGLQDRLKSLMQQSVGKRTSYIKGPRFCNTLVKSIAKCANEKLAARRDSFQEFIKERKGLATCNKASNKSNFLERMSTTSEYTYYTSNFTAGSQDTKAIDSLSERISSRQTSNTPSPMSWEDAVCSQVFNDTQSDFMSPCNVEREKRNDEHIEHNWKSTSTTTVNYSTSEALLSTRENEGAHKFTIVSDETSHCYVRNNNDDSLSAKKEQKGSKGINIPFGNSEVIQCNKVSSDKEKELYIRYKGSESSTYSLENTDSPFSHNETLQFTPEADNQNYGLTSHCYYPKRQVYRDQLTNNHSTADVVDDYGIHTISYRSPKSGVGHDINTSSTQEPYTPPLADPSLMEREIRDNEKTSNIFAFDNTGPNDVAVVNDVTSNKSASDDHQISYHQPTPDNDIFDVANSQTKGNKRRNIKSRLQQQIPKKSVTRKDLQQHIASLNKVSKELNTRMPDKKKEKNPWLKNVLQKQSSTEKAHEEFKNGTNQELMNKTSHSAVATRQSKGSPKLSISANVSGEEYHEEIIDDYQKNITPKDPLSKHNISIKTIVETDISKLKTDNLVKRHRGAHFQYSIPAVLKKRKRLKSSSESQDDSRVQTESYKEGTESVQNNAGTSPSEVQSIDHGLPLDDLADINETTRMQKGRYGSIDYQTLLQAKSRCNSVIKRRHSCHSDGTNSTSEIDKLKFSQGQMIKCLEIAIDRCESMGWEAKEEVEVEISKHQTSLQDLNKSLAQAIMKKDSDAVRILLDHGADPNTLCGNTPALLRAVRDGSLYIVQALEAAGADTDARLATGDSALHIAARNGHSEIIVHLVQSGAHVDAINRNDVTPLQMALAHGWLEVAQMLLRMKADILAQNKVGETALEIANYLGYVGLTGTPKEVRRDSAPGTQAEALPSEIPVRVRMIQGIEEGCAYTVENCLALGASPNTIVPLALHWPARAGVLHRAAHHGEDLIARLLIAAGAGVNMRDVVGNTPLHAAAQAGYNKVVKVLLANGAQLEATSQSGMTPLHRAASKGKDLTCNLLLRRGANSKAEDCSGCTPADWARKRGFKSLARKLFHRRRSSATLLAEANTYKQHLRHLNKLHQVVLQEGQDIDIDCEE